MAEELIGIDLIDANPWQPRTNEDAEHIANLAVSIADDGLMQIPGARAVAERYQLAFGHSRLAAFRLLHDLQIASIQGDHILYQDDTPMARALAAARAALDNGINFAAMPLNVMDLDDETMFRFAVSENVQRRDLSPIETARAMQRYRDEFGKSSADIGALFGVNDATVRGKLRLLDLPDQVREKLNAGNLSEGTARTLLTAQKLLGEEKITELAQKVADYKNPEEVIEQTRYELNKVKEVTQMFNARYYNDAEPNAGQGLWPLTWTYKRKFPSQKELDKWWAATFETSQFKTRNQVHEVFSDAAVSVGTYGKTWEKNIAEYPAFAEEIKFLRQLSEPPACTQCPLRIVLDGVHYCGMKLCFKRKKARWLDEQFEALVSATGIPEYQEADGPARKHNYDELKAFQKLFAERDPDVRLQRSFNEYQKDKVTDSYFAVLVDTNPERAAVKEQAQLQQKSKDRWERERALRDASDKFMQEQVYQVFGSIFNQLDKLYPTMALARVSDTDTYNGFDKFWQGLSKAEKLDYLRQKLVKSALDHAVGWKTTAQGPTATAKHLKGIAITWGVQLPGNWLEMAASYEPFAALESVAVETLDEPELEEIEDE